MATTKNPAPAAIVAPATVNGAPPKKVRPGRRNVGVGIRLYGSIGTRVGTSLRASTGGKSGMVERASMRRSGACSKKSNVSSRISLRNSLRPAPLPPHKELHS
jgi:hypothetical protein